MQRPAGKPAANQALPATPSSTARAPGHPDLFAESPQPSPSLPTMLAAACTAAKPAVAVRQASSSAPRRNARRAAQRLQPVRAAEDDRAAQLKAAMEQVQSNPEVRDTEVFKCVDYTSCSTGNSLCARQPASTRPPAVHCARPPCLPDPPPPLPPFPLLPATRADGCQDEADGGGDGQPRNPVTDGSDDVSRGLDQGVLISVSGCIDQCMSSCAAACTDWGMQPGMHSQGRYNPCSVSTTTPLPSGLS